MWQNWLSGILGLWLILVVLLGFSSTLNQIFFILTGLAITVLSFWSASKIKPFPKNSESEIIPASLASLDASRSGPAGGSPVNGNKNFDSKTGEKPAQTT
ncbi:MAG: hypothetical protein Q8N42_01815 [bacterium]|nr:hypothetical protein [bacterium]